MTLMFDIDPAALTVVLEAIIALLLAIIAYFNKQRTVIQQAVQTASMPVLQAPAIAPAPIVKPLEYAPVDNRKPGTTQIGSQYWMNAGYTGVEPSEEEKAVYTDAQRAYEDAVSQANALIGKYGESKVTPAVKAIATVKQK